MEIMDKMIVEILKKHEEKLFHGGAPVVCSVNYEFVAKEIVELIKKADK